MKARAILWQRGQPLSVERGTRLPWRPVSRLLATSWLPALGEVPEHQGFVRP